MSEMTLKLEKGSKEGVNNKYH